MLDDSLLIKHKETSLDLLLIGAAINRHIPETATQEERAKIIDNHCEGLPLEQKAAIMAIIEDIRERPTGATLSRSRSSRSKNTKTKATQIQRTTMPLSGVVL